MSSRMKTISKLLESRENRESYIRAKLNHLIPSQIRALRLREEWTQKQLADESGMKQARISAVETPGVVNFSLETLIRLAAAYRVALQVRFVPYSAMIDWEDKYSQDTFAVTPIEDDGELVSPSPRPPKAIVSFEYTPTVAMPESRIATVKAIPPRSATPPVERMQA
jgi:transcriptional regulator with XRE-family HTH domain